ncbi:MAG TPA: bifunctional precorrin-2 dehydrogenase/sirohydrochlorin ferrochelatase [Acidimicrobiales bacterium]|nr:bifunctional precorrin-2 dehydrogenase/sirohydrochlorin ferrochelatase [Acidimicrobiales bacterium]
MPIVEAQYPVNLVLTGKKCLVVGGGGVATRKVEGLLACGADVTVIAPEVDAELAANPDVRVLGRDYVEGDAARGGYRLVITATDDRVTNQRVHDDADAAGVWVNSADDPDRCTFTLPAIVRNGPLMFTVATGGHSPALASHLKARLAEEYGGEDYRMLLDLLGEARSAVLAEGRTTEGLAWQTALDSDMLSLIRGGRISEARDRLKTCLSSS